MFYRTRQKIKRPTIEIPRVRIIAIIIQGNSIFKNVQRAAKEVFKEQLSRPLISVTGERERMPSPHLDMLKDVAVLQAIGSAKFHI
jgi:hypothetical protein